MAIKPRVLFVGGYGRSGSTIIDLLLDRVPGIVSVGEFRHLFGRALGDNELCSCGEKFNECTFWTEVISKAFPEGVNREEIHEAMLQINRVVSTRSLQDPGKMSPKMKAAAEIYENAFSKAYTTVAEVSGAKVIIDSSKYPAHGLFLNNIEQISLSTMLLVRDPRAVAYSWQRRRIRPEVHWEKREMPRHNVARSALAWILSNILTEKITTQNFRTQKYEDFVENPQDQLQEIASLALGEEIELRSSIFEKAPRMTHTIAGNPVRIGSDEIKIKKDSSWQKKMPLHKKLIVSIVCLPFLGKYGYTFSS